MSILSIDESKELLRVDNVMAILPCWIRGYDNLRRSLIETIKSCSIDIIEENTLRYIIQESYLRSEQCYWKVEIKFYRMPWLWAGMNYIPEHVLIYPTIYGPDGFKFISPFIIVGPGTEKLNPIRPRGLNFQRILSTYYEDYKIATPKEICLWFNKPNEQVALWSYLRNAGIVQYAEILKMYDDR